MLRSKKFNDFDLMKKLTEKGWKGRYFSYDNKVTYLTDFNETIAIAEYDNRKSLILKVKFER